MNEQELKEHLAKLDKETIIELYLQKCFDYEQEELEMLKEHKFYADNIIQAYADKCKNHNQERERMLDDIMVMQECNIKKDQRIAELEEQLAQAKMNESFEKEKKENAWKFIEELKQQLAEKEKEIELAVEELDDAKDMLREAGKNDWANTLNTSADYFKARAKEELNNEQK